tara:strand:- start:439 stop:570 length:132 start_codon:yes stop_codon:yes gene_type:complete
MVPRKMSRFGVVKKLIPPQNMKILYSALQNGCENEVKEEFGKK